MPIVINKDFYLVDNQVSPSLLCGMIIVYRCLYEINSSGLNRPI